MLSILFCFFNSVSTSSAQTWVSSSRISGQSKTFGKQEIITSPDGFLNTPDYVSNKSLFAL